MVSSSVLKIKENENSIFLKFILKGNSHLEKMYFLIFLLSESP